MERPDWVHCRQDRAAAEAAHVAPRASGATTSDAEWRSMLRAIGRAETNALERFYDRTVARFYALALHIADSVAAAEATITELYAEVARTAAVLAEGNASPERKLLGRCRALALARANPAQPAGAVDLLAMLDGDHPICARVDRLDRQERAVVALAFLRGLPIERIAATLGIHVATAKALARSATSKLRD